MNVFITQYSFRKIKNEDKTIVTLHFDIDCKLLNSPYQMYGTRIPNSGILKFESEKIVEEFLKKYNCSCVMCSVCEVEHAYSEYIKEQEFLDEIWQEYEIAFKEGRIIKLN